MSKWIDLPVKELVRRYAQGESTRALARAYGVSNPTIGDRLHAAGVKMHPQKHGLLPLPLAELIVRYEAGESLSQLGRAYGVNNHTVQHRLHAAGIRMRPSGGQPGTNNKTGRHKPGGPLHTLRGYLRTADRQGRSCRVHRGCWEAYRGAIPKGYVIHHIDEDQLNNTIGNLACMTNSEHARLHAE